MYKLCKTEQSAQRQRQLEEGLLSAMKTKRYEEITISDLCVQMGIPRKSFYRYFASKDGALYALIDHTLLEFEQHTGLLSGNALGGANRDLRRFFEFWHRQKPLLDALDRSGLSGILVQRAIAQAQSEYVVPCFSVSSEGRLAQNHALLFCICGLMNMMDRWHRSGYAESTAEMAAIATSLLTKPLIRQ